VRGGASVLVLAVASVGAARWPEAAAPQPAVAPLANVDMSLLLVGDAGAPLFAQSRSGFVRLDFAPGGGARLAVFTVNNRGEANEVYAHALTEVAR